MSRVAAWISACVFTGAAILLFVAFLRERSIIEDLSNPKSVIGRTSTGLVLEDGTLIALPEVNELRATKETPFLDTACSKGIDFDGDRAIGLMKIHHWCGNDPVRTHIARVDLADLVLYVSEGTGSANFLSVRLERTLTEAGWNISDYVMFLSWRQHLKNARPPASRSFKPAPRFVRSR